MKGTILYGIAQNGDPLPVSVDSLGRVLTTGTASSVSGGSVLYTYTPTSPNTQVVGSYTSSFDFITLEKATNFNASATVSIGSNNNTTLYTPLLTFPHDINQSLRLTVPNTNVGTPIIIYFDSAGAGLGEFLITLHGAV